MKLSKKKPIKITAGASEGGPDPAQIKLRLSNEPIENGQSPSSVNPNILAETEQPKEKSVHPVKASQPTLGIGGRERPNIPPRGVSRPNGNGNGDPGGNGSSHGKGSSSHENGGPNGNGNPPGERNSQGGGGGSSGDGGSSGRGPPREDGNPDGGDGGSDPDDSGDGDDSSSSSDSTLHRRRRHRRPKMFMYCKDLQGHQARKGNLDRQEEMAEMGKLYH